MHGYPYGNIVQSKHYTRDHDEGNRNTELDVKLGIHCLTHWDQDKMDAIPQTTFWCVFPWNETLEF